MKTWRCWSMHVEGSRYNVYAREEPDGDTIVVAEHVSGNEASDLVRGFRPPDAPKRGLYTCLCGHSHECPTLAGPFDERLANQEL
jgi:hypothetical protein